MHTVNFPWQQLAGTIKVKSITVLRNGTYLGLGEDCTQYTRVSQISEWVPVGDGDRFNWVSLLRDGGLLFVGLDGCLYTRATPTSGATLIGGSGTVKAAAQMRDGTIVAVGMDGLLYTRANLHGDWSQIPNSGGMIGLSILADDSIVGIGTDNNLYVWGALTGGWSKVHNSGHVIALAELQDGSFLGIGTNGLVQRAPRLVVGAQHTGFVPLDYEPDYKIKVHPTMGFLKFDANEQKNSDDAIAAVHPSRSTDPYLALRACKQNWNNAAVNYSFSSVADYKAAWSALMSALLGKPYTPAYDPVWVLANGCFEDAPGHAAYFKGNPGDFSERHARMFASTSQYRGPGRYAILCANLQVIHVTICGDTLVGKTYKIVSRSSGMVMTVKGNAAGCGTQLVQAPDTGAAGQRWYLRLQNGLGHALVSKLNDQVIDVPGSNASAGVGLQLWDFNGSAAQHWRMTDLGGGHFKINSAMHGMGIDVPNSSTTADTQLVTWHAHENANQQWTLVAG